MQKDAKNVYIVHGGGVENAGTDVEKGSKGQNIRVYAGISKIANEIF